MKNNKLLVQTTLDAVLEPSARPIKTDLFGVAGGEVVRPRTERGDLTLQRYPLPSSEIGGQRAVVHATVRPVRRGNGHEHAVQVETGRTPVSARRHGRRSEDVRQPIHSVPGAFRRHNVAAGRRDRRAKTLAAAGL